MTRRIKFPLYLGLILPLTLPQGGCTDVLGFSTATKFALDVSQRADQSIDVSLGYDRVEVASIPVARDKNEQDATQSLTGAETGNSDAYSVLGSFKVKYGNPFNILHEQPFELDQFFATGIAARRAAELPAVQEAFGRKAGTIVEKNIAPEGKP